MDSYNRHYIRIGIDNIVTFGFSDAFDASQANDICINETGGRQFELLGSINPSLVDIRDAHLYKWIGTAVVETNEEERNTELSRSPTLGARRTAKLQELSTACNTAIVSGCDVTLSDTTTAHFSLAETDQINLTAAAAAIQQGATTYPYHADGQLCRLFPAADIQRIGEAATAHKLYHTTTCNHLMEWARRAETAAELGEITYGATLPPDLAAHMEEVLGNVQGSV